ncbi:MAG: DUF1007 family protein, partial [Candidatus Margulisiibacteriota bacterium]
MSSTFAKFCISILFAILFNCLAIAHPHMWINADPIFVFSNSGLEEVKVTWNFDGLFSEQVVVECDKNHNGYFEPDEKLLLKKNYFDTMADYQYLTKISLNGKPYKDTISAANFDGYIDPVKKTIVYSF